MLALTVLIPVLALAAISPAKLSQLVAKESGIIEIATVVFLLPGIAVGLWSLCRAHSKWPSGWVTIWIAIWILAMVYFAGEEISWGQHLFHWTTPDVLDSVNDQGETNLHNISSLFDQKPRLFVEMWVLIAGVILPIVSLIQPRKKEMSGVTRQRSTGYWILPTAACLPVGLAWCVFRGADVIQKKVLTEVSNTVEDSGEGFLKLIGASETQECCIALFLMVYMLSIAMRSRPS